MGDKINTLRIEKHLTEEDICRVGKPAKEIDIEVITQALGTLELGYLKKLTNFARTDNPDGSADFEMALNLGE